jgi:hypothetical protein
MSEHNTFFGQFGSGGSSGGGGSSNTIYTADDTIGTGRELTLTDTVRFKLGTFIVQGGGTSTGSTLALYDNDTTPYKRFEILDNGQFRLDSSNAVVTTPVKIEMRPVGGTGTPPYFMIKNYGEVEIYGGLSNLFNVQNTLGAKQFEVLNGTTKINGGCEITSSFFQVVTNTQKMSFNAGSGGALHHEIMTNGGGGAIKTRFNITGTGSQFIVNASAIIGTEEISLQGHTLVKGADTLSTSSALQIYDGDGTPSVLWDFRNNGDIKVNQDVNIIANSNSVLYFKFCRPANGVNYSSIFSTELLNSSNVQTSYAQFGGAIVNNTAGNETGAGFINIEKNGTTTRALDIDTVNGLTINNNISSTNLLKVGNHLTVSKSTGDTTVTSTSFTPFTTYRSQGGTNYGNEIQIDLNNSSNAQTTFGTLTAVTESNTAGSETGRLELKVSDSGTVTTKLSVKNTSIISAVNLDMSNNRITNAVVNPSVQETTSTATLTIDADTETDGVLTAMAVNLAIASPTGTPVQGQSLVFRFKDDGSARTLTWNAIFRAIGVTLPTTTTASKLLYIGCKYNSTDTKWDVVSVQEEA